MQEIEVSYSKKGTPFVYASDLRKKLEIQTPLSIWFPQMIDYGFIENEDYYRLRISEIGDIDLKYDWAVKLEMAKHIAMVQRTEKGKSIRKYLIYLDEKVQEGLLLNRKQISALFEICKVLGYFTVQKFLEREHYEFLDKPKNWWEYRANLFGYRAEDLKQMVEALGKKYKTQRQALFHIDKYELIRISTIDLFIAMGKSEGYSKNIAAFVEDIAKEIQPDIYNDEKLGIDFKTVNHHQTIEQIKNYKQKPVLFEKF